MREATPISPTRTKDSTWSERGHHERFHSARTIVPGAGRARLSRRLLERRGRVGGEPLPLVDLHGRGDRRSGLARLGGARRSPRLPGVESFHRGGGREGGGRRDAVPPHGPSG